MAENPNELKKPAGTPAPAADEPVIHVIPEKFYGAALRKKIPKNPPPQAMPGTPPPPAPPKKGGPAVIAIIAIAAVVLIGGGAAAYFLVFKKPAAVVNTTPPPPPPPVCGDKKCEAPGETPASCSADCGPPPPVCGDRKCDSTESPQNCSADCGPPPPVCGDSKCEAPETFESCANDCKPPEPTPGLDSDSDGLTDEEERSVFNTNPNDPNTDKDSYVDLNEALNLFDPSKPAPSSLKDNPGIAVYSNADQNYVIFRPAAWTIREGTAEAKKEIFFDAATGEFIEVLVQDKEKTQPIMDWYLAQAPGVTSSQVELYKTKQGYDAVLSPDKFTAYVDGGERVYVVSYNLGKRFEIQYKVTFQMMVQSLTKLTP
ncbi:MAG TPA: thrombospondin type 3 repeat-containing protein [Candidatus Eisenbacteria bacterium]|nr:thrombospondin type 3 repeat-containing protein [Candidatus Eisenbacteria bacterium]